MYCNHFKSVVEVRLVNGFTQYEGRVEVYYNGEWGTVCNYGWSLNNAEVVCRQLGLTPAVGVAFFGSSSGRIWLDDIYCDGTESNIGHCPHTGWGYNDLECWPNGVRCAESNGMQIFLILHMCICMSYFVHHHNIYICSSSPAC